MKKLLLAGVATGLVLTLTACGQAPWEQSLRDLEGVPVKDPDQATLYNNVDLHPNLMVLCIDGVSFVTTTRPDFSSVIRVPELDKTCL